MIFNQLSESARLRALHPGFGAAFDFLMRPDLPELANGTYELDGKRLYAIVQQYRGRGRRKSRIEAHRRYIDIQHVISGHEVIGFRNFSACTPDAEGWNEANDICFSSDPAELWIPVPPGSFAIFYPEEDGHAPMAGQGMVRKVVVKILADWDRNLED
jgi:YhcH/YjgK/YiaL family protein